MSIMLFATFSINAQNAWINEIHYDNDGGDVAEGVEIVIEDAGSYTLSDFQVTPYNGNGGTSYSAATAETFTVGATEGNFTFYVYEVSLQNGAPDGVCLSYQGTVLQFLSYEGSFTATDGDANGLTSTDIGVSEAGTAAIGTSLQLSGSGTDYASFTWQPSATATAGLLNNGQSFGTPAEPQISGVSHFPVAPTTADAVGVFATITDDVAVTSADLYWSLTSPVTTGDNYISMNVFAGDVYTTTADIPAQAGGETVYYIVVAEDGTNTTTSSEGSYTIPNPETPQTTTLPYAESFDADLGQCYTYDVAGEPTYVWEYNAGGYAEANGYGSASLEEDWLILPGINLDNYSNEILTFETWRRFGSDDVDNYLTLMYSTDYTGVGDPTSSTWTPLSFTMPASDQTWTGSGDVDLSAITGTMVYIAFKYHYDSGSYVWWEVDNINIEEVTGGVAPEITDIAITPTTPSSSDAVTVSATITDADGTISTATLNWGTAMGTYTQTINMSNTSGDTYTADSNIPALPNGTTVYYTIFAEDNDTYTTTSTEQSYTVVDMPTGNTLFFSEYIESNGGNNKAVEIYNPTGATVDLTGYTVKLAANDGTWNNTADLTGYSLDAEDVFVISNSGSDAPSIVSNSDMTSNITYYNGNDALGLFYMDVLIDVIGVEGADVEQDVAGVTGATANNTLVRKYPDVMTGNTDWASSAGTDADNSEWIVVGENDFSYIGWHGEEPTEPTLVITAPTEGSVHYTSTVSVVCDVQNFDVAAGTGDGYINLVVNGVDVGSATTTSFNLGGLTTPGTYTLTTTLVDNSFNPIIPLVTYTVTFTVEELVEVSIYDIQYTEEAGDGTYPSDYVGQVVTTSGVVTATETVNDGAIVINYYIQDGDGAWNGVYVYDNNYVPEVGDHVTITAEVVEYNGLTELSDVIAFNINSSGNALPTPVTLTTLAANDEQYEGVLIEVLGATCTNDDIAGNYGMWTLNDGSGDLLVDDDLQVYTPTVTYTYDVTGLGHYSYDEYKIIPRTFDDIIEYMNEDPTLVITSPNQDEVVTTADVTVQFSVMNFVVADGTGDGHIHYSVDGGSEVMYYTTDPIQLTGLTEGSHTVDMWLVDNSHTPLDPAVEASVTFTVDLGDNVNELSNNLNVYPNPVVSVLNINTENVQTIEVYNTLGQQITQVETNSNNTQIDVSSWNSGVYFVKLSNGQTTVTKTVVKQ